MQRHTQASSPNLSAGDNCLHKFSKVCSLRLPWPAASAQLVAHTLLLQILLALMTDSMTEESIPHLAMHPQSLSQQALLHQTMNMQYVQVGP